MDDDTLAALIIWSESANQPYEGKVAVGRVIRNRMALKYESDGTVAGTAFKPNQFSGLWFSVINGRYTRDVASDDLAGAEAKAARMLAVAQGQTVWPDCVQAWADSAPGSGFVGGPEFQKLTPETVLYLNPNPRLVPVLPAWAAPDKEVCIIYDHTFYHL